MEHGLRWIAMGLLALAVATGLRAEQAANKPEAPPLPAEHHASLLGTRWDFADGRLDGWQRKTNATMSVAEECGNKALRLESTLVPYRFTWATRHFEPRSLEGVVHVAFRVRGGGSGHKLVVHLGAPKPDGRGSLYYADEDEALTLDFKGWRTVSLDLARFRTPANARRDRDLGRVTFLEFMVHAGTDERAAAAPVDAWLDDIAFTGFTPDEEAANRRREEVRTRIAAETPAAVAEIKRQLTGLREKLDALERSGKYAAVARVYWAALDWCADDVLRLVEAEEFELVQQAPALAADLKKWLENPTRVLGRVLDKPPEDKDALDAARNPYFKSIIEAARALWPVELRRQRA